MNSKQLGRHGAIRVEMRGGVGVILTLALSSALAACTISDPIFDPIGMGGNGVGGQEPGMGGRGAGGAAVGGGRGAGWRRGPGMRGRGAGGVPVPGGGGRRVWAAPRSLGSADAEWAGRKESVDPARAV